jgi:methionyl-tRNA formyltransferase
MRLLYFGMNGAFSYPPLAAVIRAMRAGQHEELEVGAVVLPASAVPNHQSDSLVTLLPPERPQSVLPLVQPYLTENIIHLAWANDIPIYLVQDMRNPKVSSLLSSLKPDIACAACFPYLIPADILAIPEHGFLNIHPSLLPDYRGPAPLFWIFRNGEAEKVGVTLHWMDEGLDSGDILSQRPLSLPDGISGPEADWLCASIGGEMLLTGLEQIGAGKGRRWAQPDGGSYQPWPTAEAFILDRHWSARRVFNFMRGTAEWNQPYILKAGSRTLTLRTAVSFDEGRMLAEPVEEMDGRFQIQFSPGALEAT